MQIDLFTFIAQIINFSILIFLLNIFLFKRIAKAMDERQAKIAKDIAGAEAKNAGAEALFSKNREMNEKISQDTAALMDEAKATALKAKEEYTALSRSEVEAAKQAWYKELEGQKTSYLDSLRSRTGEFMMLAAEKALMDLANEELSQRIAGVFISRLKNLENSKEADIKAKIALLKEPLKVRSSFEILPQVKGQAMQILKDKFAYTGQMDFEVNPEVCGVELAIGGYRVAWCVKDYLGDLEDELKKVWEM